MLPWVFGQKAHDQGAAVGDTEIESVVDLVGDLLRHLLQSDSENRSF